VGLFLVVTLMASGFVQQALTWDASLLDFRDAQADYGSVQRNYLNLVGSYLEAVNQLNLVVGREVIP